MGASEVWVAEEMFNFDSSGSHAAGVFSHVQAAVSACDEHAQAKGLTLSWVVDEANGYAYAHAPGALPSDTPICIVKRFAVDNTT